MLEYGKRIARLDNSRQVRIILHRLLEGMSDALATANWRASTLYEAGWRHLSEAATEVQP